MLLELLEVKYLTDGNDYELINHPNIIGYHIDYLEQTKTILDIMNNEFIKIENNID